jgi:pilus assembly protein CpaC
MNRKPLHPTARRFGGQHCAACPLAVTLWVTIVCSQALAQPPAPANGPVERLRRADSALTAPLDSPAAQARERSLIADVLTPESTLRLDPRRSILVRTRLPVARFSITHPDLVDIVQYSPTEFELLGLRNGETTLTMWFLGPNNTQEVLRYVVQVARDETATERHKEAYHDLQKMVNEMWPNSMVQIIPVADKIIVRGQARDAKEAAEILSLVTGQTIGQRGNLILTGTATPPYPDATDVPASQVINLLMVPGEMQVLLKVRIAEISRSALRQIGTDLNVRAGDFRWNQLLGVAGAFQAVLETDDVRLALSAVSSNAYSKILAEPNLVTLSGRPASFIAGGEFAVPIVVGVEGAAAATTNFRGFGTQVTFVPTVIDKDQIRLQVAPSFSSLNQANAVNGIPGLDTRAVTTTVDCAKANGWRSPA